MDRQRSGTESAEAWLLLQRGQQAQKNGETAMRRVTRHPQPRVCGGGFAVRGRAIRGQQVAESGVDARRPRLSSVASRQQRSDARSQMGRGGIAPSPTARSPSTRTMQMRTRCAAICATGVALGRRERFGETKDCDRRCARGSREGHAPQPQPSGRVVDALASLLLCARARRTNDMYLAAQRALDADEFLSSANLVLSRLFLASYDLGQFDKAKQWCDVATRRFPSDVRAVRCRLYMLTTRAVEPDVAMAWRMPIPRWRWYRRPHGRASD